MPLKFWNEHATVECFQFEHMLLGTEFTIEDGKVTAAIRTDGGLIRKEESEK